MEPLPRDSKGRLRDRERERGKLGVASAVTPERVLAVERLRSVSLARPATGILVGVRLVKILDVVPEGPTLPQTPPRLSVSTGVHVPLLSAGGPQRTGPPDWFPTRSSRLSPVPGLPDF